MGRRRVGTIDPVALCPPNCDLLGQTSIGAPMRITTALSFCLLLWSASCKDVHTPDSDAAASAFDPSEGLRVMSFNIRYGTANDGDNSWPNRKEQVLEVIREYDPDLLGLQEALPFQSKLLRENLASHTWYGPGRLGPGDDGEACSIYWRKDRFQKLDHGTFWLSPSPGEVASKGWDAALPRICSWVRLIDLGTKGEFIYANTHFDHRGEEARLESAKLLASYFGDDPIILTGDFNADEPSPPMRALRDAGFLDSYRSVFPDATEVGTFTGFQEAPTRGKIDYVYYRGALEVLGASIDNKRRAGRWPSDHFPVTATFRFQ
jgi:endonuclease/exonuclease/phosphatase family metal-dependent hydrolase